LNAGGTGPLLVCYDGSDGARAALERAAEALAPADVIVACYWQPFAESRKRLAVDILELVQDQAGINEREAALAEQIAEEGAARARALGFSARAEAIKITTPIDEAILAHAEELEAVTIVLGARSSSRLRSLLLGDVANEVVQSSTRPVFVVPSSRLSTRRRAALSWQTPDAPGGSEITDESG
jgi:nucleotide-binding universal stress UspA family protein